MIELRFIIRDNQKILQWRQIPCRISWTRIDSDPYIEPVGARNSLSLKMKENWTKWEDVPLVELANECLKHGWSSEYAFMFCPGCKREYEKENSL